MNNAGLMKDNERSWGIDLISQINTYALVREKESIIQYAGGEMSLAKSSGSLFPDIMLFADRAKTQVLHGWECDLLLDKILVQIRNTKLA